MTEKGQGPRCRVRFIEVSVLRGSNVNIGGERLGRERQWDVI